MSALDHAARGDKLDIHLLIYESKLAIIDGIAQRHGISRAALLAHPDLERLYLVYPAAALDAFQGMALRRDRGAACAARHAPSR